ncbi:MAG: S1 RNA-binding domain-containing protein, partial [Chloroflexi bacterium]|nr:S1 RNA-binding domain-containing protein [Chloroflexota bacterium]
SIHPESYKAVRKLLIALSVSADDPNLAQTVEKLRRGVSVSELAEQLGLGVPTLNDILEELQRPGRDPREDIPAPILRQDVLSMEDLKPGMRLKGTVRNVVDFGAFVDIGVKQDGLVHISEMADYRVRSPYDVLSVGDIIDVIVLDVDNNRGRIGLSMRGVAAPQNAKA